MIFVLYEIPCPQIKDIGYYGCVEDREGFLICASLLGSLYVRRTFGQFYHVVFSAYDYEKFRNIKEKMEMCTGSWSSRKYETYTVSSRALIGY